MSAKYLTVRQVATILQLSAKSVYGIVSSGDLPAYRVGGAVRVSQADLDDYLAARRTTGRTPAAAVAARLQYRESALHLAALSEKKQETHKAPTGGGKLALGPARHASLRPPASSLVRVPTRWGFVCESFATRNLG